MASIPVIPLARGSHHSPEVPLMAHDAASLLHHVIIGGLKVNIHTTLGWLVNQLHR